MEQRQRVLALLAEDQVFRTLEEIGGSLELNAPRVRELLEDLRLGGERILEIPGRGFGLGPVADILFEKEIQRYLRTRQLGRPIVFRHEVSSTNSLAMSLAESGQPHGTAVVADRQTGGRGRMGRSWASPAGVNLYLSLVLRPELPPSIVTEIPIVFAVAAARALERQDPPVRVGIKWPNDLLHDGRKLGGILCEMRASSSGVHFLVAGIGINVNMVVLEEDLAETATSMALATGGTYLRPLLAADLLEELETSWEAWLGAGSLEPFLGPWMERSVLEGRRIRVAMQPGFLDGTAEGLSASGALRLRLEDGSIREVYSGDAHIGPLSREMPQRS